MEIKSGRFYFVKDEFFEKINDPYLKTNRETTKRPHYFAIKDEKTGLYWLVPISSKVEKYEKIIKNKQNLNKPTDAIKIIRVFNEKSVLLFQDMFPVTEQYIKEPYIKGNQSVRIESESLISELSKNAQNIISKIRNGVKFTPTQPDIKRIEQLMLAEIQAKEQPPQQINPPAANPIKQETPKNPSLLKRLDDKKEVCKGLNGKPGGKGGKNNPDIE